VTGQILREGSAALTLLILVQIAAVAKKRNIGSETTDLFRLQHYPPPTTKMKYKHCSYSVPNSISNCIAAEGTDKKEEA